MPLGVTESYTQAERDMLYDLFRDASNTYPFESDQFDVLIRAMADIKNNDPLKSAVEYSERQLRQLWVALAAASAEWPIDSEQFHALVKAMADTREMM